MPELPEVTTTVKGLQKVLLGLAISDVWTDLPPSMKTWRASAKKIKMFKNTAKDPFFFKLMKKKLVGQKVLSVERRAKNILISISNGETILVHLKMTGHLLYGKYTFDKKENKWSPGKGERPSLSDPYNRYIHFVFSLSNGKHLAFSDSRKFGKITIIKTNNLEDNPFLKQLGPEPLGKNFSFPLFKSCLLSRPAGKIKTVLMDQTVIAGIGNIYSDEMLWLSSIHPESKTKNIPDARLLELYYKMKEVLKKGIDFGGDSMSDYRNIYGESGNFQSHHNVYRKKGEKCMKKNCTGVIIRKVINGRSAHFCNKHQKLFE